MIITRTSMMSGKTRQLNLPITTEEFDRWRSGEKVQDVWPHLTADEREFLLTGITPEEWDELWAEPDDDHNPDLEDEVAF